MSTVVKGIILVALSAVSYGVLATLVKLSYESGFTTSEITTAQFTYGIVAMALLVFFQNKKQAIPKPTSKKDKFKLIITGTSLGLTSVLYYLSVSYVPVSIAIVLLMQTVWMGVVLEAILDRKFPTPLQVVAVILVIIGTVFAAKLLENNQQWNYKGIIFGLLAAVSFTTTKYTSNRVATHLKASIRSLYMLVGGAIVVLIFTLITQHTPFQWDIFTSWGIWVALFGTIIPPLLLNAGYPLTGLGLGSIVSSLELAVSVLIAHWVLQESVSFGQIIGVLLILFAIVVMNIRKNK